MPRVPFVVASHLTCLFASRATTITMQATGTTSASALPLGSASTLTLMLVSRNSQMYGLKCSITVGVEKIGQQA